MSAPRCKPGDLAYVVGGQYPMTPGLVGRMVIVERAYQPGEPVLNGTHAVNPKHANHPIWWCRAASSGSKLPVLLGSGRVVDLDRRPIIDAVLRPIRPDEGEDESLSWSRPRVGETA